MSECTQEIVFLIIKEEAKDGQFPFLPLAQHVLLLEKYWQSKISLQVSTGNLSLPSSSSASASSASSFFHLL